MIKYQDERGHDKPIFWFSCKILNPAITPHKTLTTLNPMFDSSLIAQCFILNISVVSAKCCLSHEKEVPEMVALPSFLGGYRNGITSRRQVRIIRTFAG
jgi:hypothetical protein